MKTLMRRDLTLKDKAELIKAKNDDDKTVLTSNLNKYKEVLKVFEDRNVQIHTEKCWFESVIQTEQDGWNTEGYLLLNDNVLMFIDEKKDIKWATSISKITSLQSLKG